MLHAAWLNQLALSIKPRILRLPDVRARFAALGLEAVGNDPAQFAKIIKNDLARWAEVVRRGNVRID